MNNNNNMNMAQLMAMLSKMDKKDLEQGLNKVSQMLKSKDADAIIDEIKKINKFLKWRNLYEWSRYE